MLSGKKSSVPDTAVSSGRGAVDCAASASEYYLLLLQAGL